MPVRPKEQFSNKNFSSDSRIKVLLRRTVSDALSIFSLHRELNITCSVLRSDAYRLYCSYDEN